MNHQATHNQPTNIAALRRGVQRYGFNGKEIDNEVIENEQWQDYGLRLYNVRLCRFPSIDPLAFEFPWYTPFQFAGNCPIKFIDLDGGEPKDPGKNAGDIEEAPVQGHESWGKQNWSWDGSQWAISPSSVAPEIVAENSNADPSWKSFITGVSQEEYDDFVEYIYSSKLSTYEVPNGLNIGLYGRAPDGTVNVPQSLKSNLIKETKREAMSALKAGWASNNSGVAPNSLSYSLNPCERAHYNYWRNLAVSSSSEAWGSVSVAALEIATAWTTHLHASYQSFSFHRYPKAEGLGLNFYVGSERSIGIDWHKFRIGGKKTGTMINAPHIDIPNAGVKHFPWHQISKFKRGV
ncbi:MAG: RHS repeat-associated core domain-containing protein [Pseudomonadota bacterium]